MICMNDLCITFQIENLGCYMIADKQATHRGENSERANHPKESERRKPKLSASMMSATSWACVGFSLEDERVMQQSSVSNSLSFWEPRYQSSRTPRTSPSHLHKQINPRNQRNKGVVNPFTVTYESEIWHR